MFADNPTARLVAVIGGSIVGLGLIVAIAVSATSTSGEQSDAMAFGEVTIEGEGLPVFDPEAQPDPALGQVAPTVTSDNLDKTEKITIGPDGRVKVLLFLAHWCPHCQREVPVVVDYLANNPLPEGVDFYGISTLANKLQANFPPHKWLQRENFDFPALLDSREHEIQEAYGLFGTPFWVILDGNNRVVQRTSGELPVEMLDQIFRGAGALAEAGDLPIPDTAP